MSMQSLNGVWKIRWSTGQRGGDPFVIKHTDDHDHMSELKGLPRELPGHYTGRGWLDAVVPGDVHLDLMRLGLLDDPYIGINVFKARWVEECVWHYRRTFDAPPEALNGYAVLRFGGIDLNAIVYLNGEEIGRHDNAFTPCLLDVTGKLKPTDNELLVRVESGLFAVSDHSMRNAFTSTGSVDQLLHKRLFMRKPQSHTEWDWSPRLLNVGLYGDVSLEYDGSAVIAQASLRQQVSPDLTSAVIEGRLFPACGGDAGDYRLVIEADGRREERRFDRLPDAGIGVAVTVSSPRLWWPVGYGDQPLYPVTLTLFDGKREVFRHEQAVGLRHVEVRQPPHPVEGYYFIVEINRTPVFFKGGNFVPNDMITAAITKERYDRLTDLALEANFNMLRVWGGGLYESDDFYALCDRKGILVWQEFISACGQMPDDPAFTKELIAEATWQLRRLSAYASLVIWCGNNEISPYQTPLYMRFYPALVAREDPEKYYQPASPYTANDLEFAPKDSCGYDYAGDQHPWAIGFLDKDHRKYRQMACRFPNEGGILGPTSLPTVRSCTEEGPGYAQTMSWEVHDNMEHFWKEGSSPDEDARFWLQLTPDDLTLPEYVLGGGYVQGEGLAEYIDNFRRREFDSASAVFWMFNDCWPCPRSWTIVDYRLNRTPAFYAVRRAFAPLRVVPVRTGDGSIAVYGVNGTLQPETAALRFGVFTCGGTYRYDRTEEVTLPPNASAVLAVIPAEAAADPADIPFAVLTDRAGNEICRNRLLDLRYFEYPLKPPHIRVTRDGNDTVLEADSFVMGVCLDLNGETPLADNLFDLFPHMPYRLKDQPDAAVEDTINALLLRHGVCGKAVPPKGE